MAQFYGRLLERIEALPGVRSVAAASFLPMSPGINRSETLGAEGVPFGPSAPEPGWRSIDYRYLTTMGIQLLEGRDLRAGDDAQAPPVVIVDEVVALRLWTAGEAIGRRIKVGPPTEKNKRPWMTVVGVAKEVKQVGLSEKSRGVVYYPLPQRTLGSQYLVVRTSFADPLPITSAIRTEIAAIDPDLPVSDIRTMEQRLANSVSEPRFTMALLIIFAVVAAFLAAVGIYGVVAYSVAQRTHEIGLRQALGAQRSDIFRLVVGQGMKVVMIGAGCGLLAAWWATGGLQTLLYEVTTRDPLIFMTVPLLLIAVGLLANLLPAYRASKLDPARALHHD
jgi:putative ABC transport system permease protein